MCTEQLLTHSVLLVSEPPNVGNGLTNCAPDDSCFSQRRNKFCYDSVKICESSCYKCYFCGYAVLSPSCFDIGRQSDVFNAVYESSATL